MSVDNADTEINNINTTPKIQNTNNITIVNETNYQQNSIAHHDGKVHIDKTVKEKSKKKTKPTITMTGRPSCTRCAMNHCSYTWRTKTYVNYCPNCHHWNCLGNKHKVGAVHEKEITCFRCDSDFCVNCGKEKYSYSRVYLRKT